MRANQWAKTALVCVVAALTGACGTGTGAVPRGASVTSMTSVTSTTSSTARGQSPGGVALLQLARQRSGAAARTVEGKGATTTLTSDGLSFAVVWLPASCTADPANCDVIASIHGHGGWAFEDMAAWLPHVAGRNIGIVSLQWYYGGDESTAGYATPDAMYAELSELLARLGIKPGNAMFHGFSRGSANIYALAALDRQDHKWARLYVANAGGAQMDYPPTGKVASGTYGELPFAGAAWMTFCGGQDPEPQRDGCPAMRRTGDWLRSLGATVTAREDATADHGGFHRVAANARAALDLFDQLG